MNHTNRRAANLSAPGIRSQFILEVATGIISSGQPLRQAKVFLREQGTEEWPLCLFASSTNEGIDAVVNGQATMAMINPSAALTLAYRGFGSYGTPQPICAITVIPSLDQCVFAVKKELGVTTLEDVAARRIPLTIGVRGQRDHCLHAMLDDLVRAAGFTPDDLIAWGGAQWADGFGPPRRDGAKFAALAAGEIDAIFDEGAAGWLDDALDAGMTILSITEGTIQKLEQMGYRRSLIRKAQYPKLPDDVVTLDFSGWPVFVHADLPDTKVEMICEALDARKDFIPWQGDGPLPLDRMCGSDLAAPLDVPLHPAAARFWRSRGYVA